MILTKLAVYFIRNVGLDTFRSKPKARILRSVSIFLAITVLISLTYTYSIILDKYPRREIINEINSFAADDSLDVVNSEDLNLHQSKTVNSDIIQYVKESSGLSATILKDNYKETSFSIFLSEEDSEECRSLRVDETISFNKYSPFKEDIDEVIKVLQHQLVNDEAFRDIARLFEGQIPLLIKEGTVTNHFFQLMGTSVWLKEYEVHLMVSRVLYTKGNNRSKSKVSLLYGQIFNKDWEHMNNFNLKVPSSFGGNRTMNFPSFIPIPFFYSDKGMFFGPEDGRLLLVQNEYGFEEPVLIFNSITILTSINDEGRKKEQGLRAMFIAWLFQTQTGKVNTDGNNDARFDNITYVKVRRLSITGENQPRREKNWTPFVDPRERNPSDRNLYLVYDWNNLQVLKCQLSDLTSDYISRCERYYAQSKQSRIGPIRGGTELIPLSTVFETRSQAWVGFVRSHFVRCGCAKAWYRPHFVLLQRNEDKFRVTHMSAPISFNIPAKPLDGSVRACGEKDANVLMANGISHWKVDSETGSDYLTLTFSADDKGNILLHVKDFGKIIERLDLEVAWDTPINRMRECVVKDSKDICEADGIEMKRLGIY
ncbi:uncharacterized protein SPAPADRAFT_52589 [Spathaspora passalidarum NRRL Y-27907]|uniref:Uncharacterized protein n=1 Tax=Spathaspora passalidarum (strain NRRL Y-27907 / 11-Y1) TaxID=619300 RepID=G3AUD4_SPAPN|nr:uncharacterized protein SPAPADRAFT_52589 [Spathaspora passalidarum NRRL Y-27907]EGW30510.1 hypothetical protein SPAPADRAFT_52589 [Spathaspora passalidarum NRRL Y-27907]